MSNTVEVAVSDSANVDQGNEDALKEALEVGLDLSREERESHYSKKGLVILFYS